MNDVAPSVYPTKSGKGALIVVNESDDERAARRRRRLEILDEEIKDAQFTPGQIQTLTRSRRPQAE